MIVCMQHLQCGPQHDGRQHSGPWRVQPEPLAQQEAIEAARCAVGGRWGPGGGRAGLQEAFSLGPPRFRSQMLLLTSGDCACRRSE